MNEPAETDPPVAVNDSAAARPTAGSTSPADSQEEQVVEVTAGRASRTVLLCFKCACKKTIGARMSRSNLLSKWFKENLLLLLTIAGVIFGIVLGLCLKGTEPSSTAIHLISYPGELFMRLLKLFILPLIVSSLISGSASLNAKTNGMMAVRTLTYFGCTTLLNAVWGTTLAIVFHPGSVQLRQDLQTVSTNIRNVSALDSFLDLGRNVFPDNIFGATFSQALTSFSSEWNTDLNRTDIIRDTGIRAGTNTIGIIVFCFAFGIVLGTLGKKTRILVEFFTALDEVIMKLVTLSMWCTPIGVASIITGKILSIDNIVLLFKSLGMYILVNIGGVIVYQAVIMPLIFFIFVRKNPFKFWLGLLEAELTAFATASTAVALPITYNCMDKMGYDIRVAHFVLPIGATVNMDGTAMFVSIASIFVAQLNGIPLQAGDYATVLFTAAAASIAAASIPSAALVLMLIVLSAINCPAQDVAILYTVDWLVDRFRTTNNMLGDCYTAAVVEKLSQNELRELDQEHRTNGHIVHDEHEHDDHKGHRSRSPSVHHNNTHV